MAAISSSGVSFLGWRVAGSKSSDDASLRTFHGSCAIVVVSPKLAYNAGASDAGASDCDFPNSGFVSRIGGYCFFLNKFLKSIYIPFALFFAGTYPPLHVLYHIFHILSSGKLCFAEFYQVRLRSQVR